jgi:hypothetical protein
MTTKDDARLTVFVGKTFSVQTREMFEATVFDEVSVRKWLFG